MLEIVILILPVFTVLGIGALLRAGGIADETWIEVLNRFALYVAFPALVFESLTNLDKQELMAKTAVYKLNALLILFIILATVLVVKILKVKEEIGNAYVIGGFYGNIAYLGYPVVTSVYPDVQGELSILISMYVFFLFTMGIVILEISRMRRVRFREAAMNIAKNPFIIAIVLGILCIQFRVQVPRPLAQMLSMLKASASPVALLSLGIFITRRLNLRSVYAHSAAITFLRLAAVPMLFCGAGKALGVLPSFSVSIIEAGMPLGITPFALSSVYPIDREVIVSAIVLSTLLSIVTLPALISIL